MNNTITNEDLLDEGLQNVMGPDRCYDATGHVKKVTTQPKTQPAKMKPIDKPITAQWEPAKPAPNWLDKLQACAREVIPCSGLCLLFFYWQQSGLMDSSAAVPSMLACMLLAGVGIGKNILK